MSRGAKTVKTKLASTKGERRLRGRSTQSPITPGLIDLHFHGAFGVDLMTASEKNLHELSAHLWDYGLAGFCPTTLTTNARSLTQTVSRLGQWIRKNEFPGSRPLGIHLEGPWIHPKMNGAHPARLARKMLPQELELLWEASRGTLKIITLAPEILSPGELQWITQWGRKNQILLSAGHSQATTQQASQAFQAGFSGVTHAWNALAYHHREPGVLGAALGNPKIYLELIIDCVHLSPTWIRFTRRLHPEKSICLVSDCTAASHLNPRTPWAQLGQLRIRSQQGASRSADGRLAGGSLLLPESYCNWLLKESQETQKPIRKIWEESIDQVTRVPAQVLGISPRFFADRQIQWEFRSEGGPHLIPID